MIKRTSLLAVSAAAALAQTISVSSALAADDTAQKKAETAPAAPAAEAAPAAPEAAAPDIELKDPVAVVNGENITKAQLNEALANALASMGAKPEQIPAAQKIAFYHHALDGLIAEKLVSQAAAGIDVPQSEIDDQIAKAKKNFPSEDAFNKYLEQNGQTPEKLSAYLKPLIQQQKWMEKQLEGKVSVDEAQAKKFYDENKEQFQQPETVKASHILIKVDKGASDDEVKKKLAEANKVEARLKKEDFAAVAKEVSEDPGSKDQGGDLGFFTKDRMVPEFADVAFKEKVGDVSEPVRTEFGWHIIKVTDKKPAGTVPYDEAKSQLMDYLKQSQQQMAVQEVVKNLRSTAKIEDNLPPAPAEPTAAPDASDATNGQPPSKEQ